MKVMTAGKFDIIHDGHLDHIHKAYHLGEWLVIVTHPDEIVKKVSGECRIPLWARVELLKGVLLLLGGKGEVLIDFLDEDGCVTRMIDVVKPDIFARGGDRTPKNMPADEIDACNDIDCQVVYRVGGMLNSSSRLKRETAKDD